VAGGAGGDGLQGRGDPLSGEGSSRAGESRHGKGASLLALARIGGEKQPPKPGDPGHELLHTRGQAG
jgi:hypothetical protein